MGNGKQGACYGPNWALQLFSYIEEGSLAALAGGGGEGPRVRAAGESVRRVGHASQGHPKLASFPRKRQQHDDLPQLGNSWVPTVPYNDDDDGTSGTALAHLSKANYVACFGGNTMLNAVPPGSTNPVNPDPGFAGIFTMVQHPQESCRGPGWPGNQDLQSGRWNVQDRHAERGPDLERNERPGCPSRRERARRATTTGAACG